jgi:hypothetical protein
MSVYSDRNVKEAAAAPPKVTAVRSTRPAADQPDGNVPRYRNMDRRSNIKIVKRVRLHHGCAPQGN